MIIAVFSEKGGVGKTTIAAHLAGWRAVDGHGVCLLDADRQGSSDYWATQRAAVNLLAPEYERVASSGLRSRLRRRAAQMDTVVLDLAGRDDSDLTTALETADVAVAPIQPSGLDVLTVGLLDDLVAAARRVNGNLRAGVILNRTSPNPRNRDSQSAWAAMREECFNLEVTGLEVVERAAVRRCIPDGLLVDEMPRSDAKAIQEMRAIYQWVFEERAAGAADDDAS